MEQTLIVLGAVVFTAAALAELVLLGVADRVRNERWGGIVLAWSSGIALVTGVAGVIVGLALAVTGGVLVGALAALAGVVAGFAVRLLVDAIA